MCALEKINIDALYSAILSCDDDLESALMLARFGQILELLKLPSLVERYADVKIPFPMQLCIGCNKGLLTKVYKKAKSKKDQIPEIRQAHQNATVEKVICVSAQASSVPYKTVDFLKSADGFNEGPRPEPGVSAVTFNGKAVASLPFEVSLKPETPLDGDLDTLLQDRIRSFEIFYQALSDSIFKDIPLNAHRIALPDLKEVQNLYHQATNATRGASDRFLSTLELLTALTETHAGVVFGPQSSFRWVAHLRKCFAQFKEAPAC
jgi:hypothetical protein